MACGEFISINFFKRLFLEITLRYKSFKSDVAKRPPSRANIGRRSGGMTGRASKTIHSGLLLELLKASITSNLLVNFCLFAEEASLMDLLISSQHKLLAFEHLCSNTSCRIFFKTFSLIVNQPAPSGAYISTPEGGKPKPRLNGGAEGARTLDILLAKQVL